MWPQQRHNQVIKSLDLTEACHCSLSACASVQSKVEEGARSKSFALATETKSEAVFQMVLTVWAVSKLHTHSSESQKTFQELKKIFSYCQIVLSINKYLCIYYILSCVTPLVNTNKLIYLVFCPKKIKGAVMEVMRSLTSQHVVVVVAVFLVVRRQLVGRIQALLQLLFSSGSLRHIWVLLPRLRARCLRLGCLEAATSRTDHADSISSSRSFILFH